MRTDPRAPRRAALPLATAAAVLLAGCVDRTVGPRAEPAGLAISLDAAAAAEVPNGSVTLDVFYRRDDATAGERVTLVTLRARSDSLGGSVPASYSAQCARPPAGGRPANCSVSIPLRVDLAGCLADPRRAPAGAGCPLFVSLVLRDAADAVLAQATVGPARVIPGQPVTLPAVELPLRGTPQSP